MSPGATRRLLSVHRWCGLIVSANLLVLALTGLILIFHDEIDGALGVVPEAAAGSSTISVARALELARATRPNAKPVYLFQDQSEHPGLMFVGLSDGPRTFEAAKPVTVDLRSGQVAKAIDFDGSFTGVVLRLHAELFAGPVGRLLVGAIALAFLISLVSGALVYGPMMKKFAFGLIRRDKARRTLYADWHKLLGAATFGWTFVVAATGLMLSLGSVLLQYYSVTELAALGAPYAKEPIALDLSRVDQALQAAERVDSSRTWSIVALPGSDLASPRHYSVLLKGGSGLEERMLTLTLVDARDPSRLESHRLPLYLRAVLLSEPLHFGDYGGLPLKLVWALFSVATIALAGGGVWTFWLGRRERAGTAAATDRTIPLSTELNTGSEA